MAAKKPAKKGPSRAEQSQRAAERRSNRGNSPNLTPSSPALPSQYPPLPHELNDEEIAATELAMTRAARAIEGTKTKGGKTVAKVEGALGVGPRGGVIKGEELGMSVDAIARRKNALITSAEDRAIAKTRETGQWHVPAGLTWYSGHGDDYAENARETGVSRDRGIAAGAVVSGANDPKSQELRGVQRMSQIVGFDEVTNVSPEASSHVHYAQTKTEQSAGSKDPAIVRPGPHAASELSDAQLAVLGSISGARYTTKPESKTAVTPDVAEKLGFNISQLHNNQRLHKHLDHLRDLGALRNRIGVTKSLGLIRGSRSWEDIHGDDPMTQPSKYGPYALATHFAGDEARISNDYNAIAHLYGDEIGVPIQLRLPFGHTESSAQDKVERHAALGVTYSDNKGAEIPRGTLNSDGIVEKPAVEPWDVLVNKQGQYQFPKTDIPAEAAVNAVLTKAQFKAHGNRPYDINAGQSVGWHEERYGGQLSPELPHPEAVQLMNEEIARRKSPSYWSPEEVTKRSRSEEFKAGRRPPEVPGQMSLF